MKKLLFTLLPMFIWNIGTAQNADSLMTEILNASVITEGNVTYKIDRTTHFFTKEQLAKASEARQVVATIPGLFIDEHENTLKTIGGKKVLILINGVKAKDTDLQLIAPGKIRKVDYYDVPPVKYMDEAEVMINLHTSRLDTGWSGVFYGRGGQIYSNFNASVGYVSGNNKVTLDLGTHFNHKRKVWDTEEGMYSCILGGNDYKYSYSQSSQLWGHQLRGGLTWLNAKEENYTMQLSLKMSGNSDKAQKLRDIELAWGSLRQKRNGNIDNNVKSLSPALELYFSKVLSPSSTLSFDIIGTTYKNNQAATSMENSDNAQGGYEDNMLLDIRKHSFTGEINYDWEKDSHHLNFGYRGMAQWLNNTHHGNGEDYMTTVNTSAHRIFGEYSSRINDFSYRLSLGATGNIRHGGAEGFKDIAFTPMVLLGYKLKSNHFLRLKLTSATNMPNIQQMSANRIMIMEGFYKSGNEHVRNSVDYGTQFMYIFRFKKKLYLTADVHYNHTLRPLYNDYIAHDRYWNLQTMNGHHSSEAGSNISVSYSPWEFVSLDIEAAAEYQTFKKDAESAAYHNWFFPVYANLTFLWKGFTLQYRHTFGGAFLNGIYLEGLEKISYINLSYAHKNLRVGIQCLFPFVDDRFSNRTNALSAIVHNTSSNLRTKNHEFGVTLSWNFIKGKSKYADKTIYNGDYDSGAFEL